MVVKSLTSVLISDLIINRNGNKYITKSIQIGKCQRSIPGNILSEKQTLVLEYDTSKRKEKDDSVMLAQSQGTLQFFYNDNYGTYIE